MTRDARRRRTEQAILDGARELFASDGFERTTIRAVAARASVDPALVMQYFGSKEGLFAASARWEESQERVFRADAEGMATAALDDMLSRFDGGGDGEAAVALMRSCLTHPVASRVMRDQVMCDRQTAVASALDGEDAELRAAVFGAVMMGVSMARYLLQLQPLASASAEQIHRVVGPALRALTMPPPEPDEGAGA